jgi:hypothetical protein
LPIIITITVITMAIIIPIFIIVITNDTAAIVSGMGHRSSSGSGSAQLLQLGPAAELAHGVDAAIDALHHVQEAVGVKPRYQRHSTIKGLTRALLLGLLLLSRHTHLQTGNFGGSVEARRRKRAKRVMQIQAAQLQSRARQAQKRRHAEMGVAVGRHGIWLD